MSVSLSSRGGHALPMGVQSRRDAEDDCQVSHSNVPSKAFIGATTAAALAFGSVDAAVASVAAPSLEEKVAISQISAPRPSIFATTSDLLSDRNLAEKVGVRDMRSSPAMSSSSLLSAAAPAPASAPASSNLANGAGVVIRDINFDGKVPKTESDEYVVISNDSKSTVDISKYYLYVATTGTQGPTFYFPNDTTLKPGASVRIYTNEIHKETGGYSFGSGKAIWSNNGGLAVLKDSNGKKIMEYKYKPASN